MASRLEPSGGRLLNPWRIAGWGLAALLLLLPAVARAPWTAADFIVMGLLFGAIGLGVELLVRRSANAAYRVGAVVALLTAFLTIWVNLAVGMIGSEDNPYNLWFAGVLLLALAGSIAVRFEARGMAAVLLAAALAQAAAGALGMPADMRGGIFSTLFAGPWLLAAGLFWVAAGERR